MVSEHLAVSGEHGGGLQARYPSSINITLQIAPQMARALGILWGVLCIIYMYQFLCKEAFSITGII